MITIVGRHEHHQAYMVSLKSIVTSLALAYTAFKHSRNTRATAARRSWFAQVHRYLKQIAEVTVTQR
jgi:hypothetical protein